MCVGGALVHENYSTGLTLRAVTVSLSSDRQTLIARHRSLPTINQKNPEEQRQPKTCGERSVSVVGPHGQFTGVSDNDDDPHT